MTCLLTFPLRALLAPLLRTLPTLPSLRRPFAARSRLRLRVLGLLRLRAALLASLLRRTALLGASLARTRLCPCGLPRALLRLALLPRCLLSRTLLSQTLLARSRLRPTLAFRTLPLLRSRALAGLPLLCGTALWLLGLLLLRLRGWGVALRCTALSSTLARTLLRRLL